MAKKKADKKNIVKLSFVGLNANEVTGSMNLIEYQDIKILVDAGLYQSNSLVNDYKVNSRKLDFNVKSIDYIFLQHAHIDHFGLTPRLFKEGCSAQIIAHHDSMGLFEPMLLDCANIMERDVIPLQKKYPNAKPIYGDKDVYNTLSNIRGYDNDRIYELDDVVSFRFTGAGHIIGAMQLEVFIKTESGHVEKLAFSGDIGNTLFDSPFIEKFKPIKNSSIFVGECTYGDSKRSCSKGDRDKDIEKLKTVIDTIRRNNKGRVFIPSFALQRTQTVLKVLYDIYGNDKDFDLPIIVDSPLAVKVTNIFNDTLIGEDKEIMDKIMSWKNLKLITDPKESMACVADKSCKLVLSSSGMIHAGRSVFWARSILPDKDSYLITCGYMAEGTIGWRIKNGDKKKTISVNGKPCKNNCKIVNLNSFSSHMQHNQMINYYKSINTDVIYLVHGNMTDKINFKKDLEIELAKMNKTTRVVAVNKGTKASI